LRLRFAERFDPLESTLRDLDPAARLRMAIVAFVRFSAEMPELSRLTVQEGKQSSWRLDYVVDTHMRPRIEWLNELLGEPLDPHTYCIVIGASAMVFDVEFECRRFARIGLHVGHVVVDGGIAGERFQRDHPEFVEAKGEGGLVDLEGIAAVYEMLHQQPKAAWSHEIDVRTNMESF
jgi:hypothetical protein